MTDVYRPAPPELIEQARAQLMSDPKVVAEYERFKPIVQRLTTHAFHALLVVLGEEVDRRAEVKRDDPAWDEVTMDVGNIVFEDVNGRAP